MLEGLDHVQIAMPRGAEPEARGFFGRLLGLRELEKPASLAGRGGLWHTLPDGRELHLGVEEPFRPNGKAHPAFAASDLDGLAGALEAEGHEVEWDEALLPRRRFYVRDPFGNRLEFLGAAARI